MPTPGKGRYFAMGGAKLPAVSSDSSQGPRAHGGYTDRRHPSRTARLYISTFVLVAVLLFGFGLLEALAQEGPNLTLVADPLGYGFYVSGTQSTNFVLETSADLKSWTNVLQSIGWPETNRVYGVAMDPKGPAHSFWRAVPGEQILLKEQRWTDQEPVEYRFRFRHMISYWEGGVQGTVRVLNGGVVEVTDAIDDPTGQPVPNPDLLRFKTITQLYECIREAVDAGAQQVSVWYDPGGLYPERIEVFPLIGMADADSLFVVSQLVVLQP